MRLLLLITVLWKFPFHRALTCLNCNDVVQPRHCATVMTCPDIDVCFVERRINLVKNATLLVVCEIMCAEI
ncbi:hypothetical protein DPMN_169502 [Dreissena polymorpha]|uniref:Secreted protein n=1 Tax=Dreissena polymorpha TaxID=45954 RepID=A0A9D4IC21_DREPO|nr:hypothetical protein DPMN_169502 [Dreissena polymorpha]